MKPRDLLNKIYGNIKPEFWMMRGLKRGSPGSLLIYYAGSHPGMRYIASLAYQGGYRERSLGRRWFWDNIASRRLRKNNDSLFIMESYYFLSRFLLRRVSFVVPSWVSSIVTFTDGDHGYEKNKSLKNDMRRIKKHRFSFEITRDAECLRYFYHCLYVPFIKKAHGEAAFIREYSDIQKKFLAAGPRCGLGVLRQGNEIVGGQIFFTRGGSLRIWLLGVKDGSRDHVNRGVVQALFQFSIRAFRERGFKAVDLGASRPFLNDGVIRFKKKWSPVLSYKKSGEKMFLVTCAAAGQAVRHFLKRNPFMFVERGSLRAACFYEHLPSAEEVNRALAYYRFRGLSELRVFWFREDTVIIDRKIKL
ncbi:MAG: GNAT family N-acetyltransferase [Candidatus Omnitrophota bacterium]